MKNSRVVSSNTLPDEAEEWFPTESSKQDLVEVKRGRDEFRAWILTNVNETKASKKSEDSGFLPTVREALSNCSSYEDSYNFVEPFSTIDALGTAARARSDISQMRSYGMRKFGYGVQKFASTFLSWFHSFKGVVDIAGSADPGLVGVAYETLNILFTIKEYLPSMIVYEQIYRNTVLGKKIAAVYKGVIFFSRETTTYYIANHGIKRWGKSFSGKQRLYAPNSNFKKDLLAVKNQCEVLLSVNVDKLKKLAEEQKKQLDKILAAASHERLIKCRDYLAQSPSQDQDLQTSLARYTSVLQKFASHERVEQLSTLELLASSTEISFWLQTDNTQLPIVAGRNELITLEQDDLSWLSPAAMSLAMQLRDQGHPVTFYMCQESSWQPKGVLPQQLFANLLYQILQLEPQLLHGDIYSSLSSAFEGRDIGTLDLDITLNILIQVLRLPRNAKRIYVVLDRIDRCSEDYVRRSTFLQSLLKLVAQTKGFRIKIMLVVNQLYWPTLGRDLKALEADELYDADLVNIFQKDQQMHPDRW